MSAESDRVARADADGWRDWGPYVSERAWGTVREDYSHDGEAWDYLPHEHARSRAYRWNEDGMAAVCDLDQNWCLGLSLWNGVDPILKERMFGLSGPQGNHGEDAKDYWWYLDSTPSHSWMTWRYHYPQTAFPYDELVEVNAHRGKDEREYELLDTGAFDQDRFWAVTVDYAKAGPHDLVMRVTAENHGPDEATLDVLPTLWFRNTWTWHDDVEHPMPSITVDAETGDLLAEHAEVGTLCLAKVVGMAESLVCDNETNTERLYGTPGRSAYPKDGINDHVVHGAATVNPGGVGTKAALRYRLTVRAGESREVMVRLTHDGARAEATQDSEAVLTQRRAEADAFFADLTPAGAGADEALVLRQAVAGLMWGKQFFHYDVARWLDGDPTMPPPPPQRRTGRNSGWRHLSNKQVISMPDPWEYPWYASWDLAFHCVAIAHVDPEFAKEQLLLMTREWYMHPDGQMPAYEWAFGDVNPPVHAWAALRVFRIDGAGDHAFLARVLHKLLLNFTWWVNRKDVDGNNIFGGGFLGLDNIGPIDRSGVLPGGATLEQSDGTAWMAMYSLNLLEMAVVLAEQDPAYEDLATKFFEHFALIADAMATMGLWDEQDRFFYDVVRYPDGTQEPLRVRSMVGLLSLCASMTLGQGTLDTLGEFADRFTWFLGHRPAYRGVVAETRVAADQQVAHLFSIVGRERLADIVAAMLDEEEFLSPHGLRALSRHHRDHPFTLHLADGDHTVDYEPGESTNGLFGGNSNWRGPVWFPVNHLVIESLRRFGRFYGGELDVELPTGSGASATLTQAADDLVRRLVGVFLEGPDGRRPVFGDTELFQTDAAWHDLVPFHEYFHGDTGRGLGASHQTGWTGLVVDLILERGR